MKIKKIDEKHKKFLASLSRSQRLRPKLKKIVSNFRDLDYFWNQANHSDFRSCEMDTKDYEEFLNLKIEVSPEDIEKSLEKENIRMVCLGDKEYPKLLCEISSPPMILFVRGELDYNAGNTIGIVGTRRPTDYGTEVTTSLAENLARVGIVIVSGLALGIDTLAHKGALGSNQKTIAVLGTSVDNNSIYPSSNKNLALKILETSGTVISEYPPGFPIFKTNFPERNRIISGLSRGLIVTEAPLRSGALITANFALEQNREVFAVPGEVTSRNSQGTNNLIKMGAKPVLTYNDVLEEFGIEDTGRGEIIADSPQEAVILEALNNGSLHIDSIAKKAQLTISETSSTLSLMEIKGKVMNLGALNFAIKK